MNSPLLNRSDLKGLAKTEIIKYIGKMDLKKSNKLPSEEQLSEMIGVSRITLRAALNELASDGNIFRRQGKGTFVNVISMGIKAGFNPVMHFSDMIKNSGYTPSIRLLGSKIIPSTKEISDLLHIPLESEVVILKKIFYADNRLCAYCVDQFSKSIISDDDLADLNQFCDSVFQFLYEKSGRQVCWDKVEIQTTDNIQTPELNKYIQLPDGKTKSFLCLKGVDFDKLDQPLLYSIEYVDTELIQYNVIRQRTIYYK